MDKNELKCPKFILPNLKDFFQTTNGVLRCSSHNILIFIAAAKLFLNYLQHRKDSKPHQNQVWGNFNQRIHQSYRELNSVRNVCEKLAKEQKYGASWLRVIEGPHLLEKTEKLS